MTTCSVCGCKRREVVDGRCADVWFCARTLLAEELGMLETVIENQREQLKLERELRRG